MTQTTLAPTSLATMPPDMVIEDDRVSHDRVSGSADDDQEINDAVMFGVETDSYLALLEQPATLLLGEMWGAKDRRNTQDGYWKPVTHTWAEWIVGRPGKKNRPAWGFSHHPVGKNKAGACIVLGSSIGQARKAKSMDTMYAMGIDIDNGTNLDW